MTMYLSASITPGYEVFPPRCRCTGWMRRAKHSNRLLLKVLLALWYAGIAHAAGADLAITPANLDFKYTAGATLAQALQIKSTGAALAFTIAITGPVPYSAEWLSVSQISGATSATVSVYVNPTTLPGGSYAGTITVNSAAAATPVHTIVVTLEVGDAPSTLTASTNALALTYV